MGKHGSGEKAIHQSKRNCVLYYALLSQCEIHGVNRFGQKSHLFFSGFCLSHSPFPPPDSCT